MSQVQALRVRICDTASNPQPCPWKSGIRLSVSGSTDQAIPWTTRAVTICQNEVEIAQVIDDICR